MKNLIYALLALTLIGCEEPLPVQALECGEGTVESEEGDCVSTLTCGEGTLLADETCQLTGTSIVCGPDTELVDGSCIGVATSRACGSGTTQDGGLCLPSAEPVSCGVGTSEVESVCVSDNPLSCGGGATLEGITCVATTCGSGTVELDGQCVGSEFNKGDPLESLLFRVTRSVCDAARRCDCLADLGDVGVVVAENPALCEGLFRGSLMSMILTFSAQNASVGSVVPNLTRIEEILAWVDADEACTVDLLEIRGLFPDDPYDLSEMASVGAVPNGEACYFDYFCTDGNHCTNEEEIEFPICRPLGELDETCESNWDCAPELYCAAGDVPSCQARPRPGDLDRSCNVSTKPCAPGFCCREGVCLDAPEVGEPCCDDGCIDDSLYCGRVLEGGSACFEYAAEGEVCESTSCGLGLRCEAFEEADDLCTSRQDACDVVNYLNAFIFN